MARFLKGYRELGIEALKQGRDREYAVWLLLRYLDDDGTGRVAIEDLLDLMRSERLLARKAYARTGGSPMRRRNLLARLRLGEGVFWRKRSRRHRDRNHIYYFSLEKVCTALRVRPRRNPVALPLAAFETVKGFRAYLVGAWIGPDRTISRATLCEMTGLTRQTLNSYDEITGTEKQQNIGYTKCKTPEKARRLIAWLNQEDGEKLPKTRAFRLRPTVVMVHMPSTYSVSLAELPMGQVRRVTKRLYPLEKNVARGNAPVRYLDNARLARKAQKRGRLALEYFVKTERVWREKWRAWAYCQNPTALHDPVAVRP